MPTDASRSSLLAGLDAARRRFLGALEPWRDDLEAGMGGDGWTVADVLRHVAAWDAAAAAGVRAVEAGQPPDVYADDIDAWNASAVQARAGKGGAALLADLDATRLDFRTALDAAPARLWGAPAVPAPNGEPVTIEGIVEVWREHDHEHAAELERLPRRGAPTPTA